jgi:5-methylcytosine-specific restriction protein A
LQLKQFPLCQFCLQEGNIEPATIVDHVEPHHGDEIKFWYGKLQSLCDPHHKSTKHFQETRGFRKDIGFDGWPIDDNHPVYTGRIGKAYSIPFDLKPSRVPVKVVCGPPASGKTTYVNEHKKAGDIVVCLDECKVRVGGRPWDTEKVTLRRALAHRDRMLRSLSKRTTGRAFVIIGAPTIEERNAWRDALGDLAQLVLLPVPADICIARLRSDPQRAHALPQLIDAVRRWRA